MDLDKFNVAVHRVQAGQFLREKTASVVGVSAIDAALQARAGQAEDPDLLKIATQLCPEDALGFYMKLGGQLKVAEPPPPPGVSLKEWDKKLQEGPEKTAGDVVKFTRPLASKVKDLAKKVLPAANGTVRKVDFTNPEGVRGALSKARDATARAAHNAKAMKNGKPSSLSDTLSYAKGALPFAGAAALAGGVSGHIRGKVTSASDRRKEEAKAGPIGRAIIRHPALAGAASAGAGTMLGLHAKTFPGALAGAVAPGLTALGADRVLKHFEDKKKGR
jgi:hypothetical protein